MEKFAKRVKARIAEKQYRDKLRARGFNDAGKFIPDAVPMAPPIGYKRQPSMVEIVRNMVRSEKLAEEARTAGMETFEESEDFDVGDDGEDLRSGFENDFDPPVSEIREAVNEARKPPVNPVEARPAAPAPDVAPTPKDAT